MSLVTIVLAAGMSRRMGGVNKLAALVDGRPVLTRTVDAILAAGLSDVRVVVGHEAAATMDLLAGRRVAFAPNPDYATGIASSLAAGVRTAPPDASGILICLGDLPWLDPADVRRVVEKFAELDGRSIVRPCFAGARGHPVALPAQLRPELLRLQGDCGARELIRAGINPVAEVLAGGSGVLRDVDRPGELEA